MSSEPTTARPIIYLGMDVHKDSITIADLTTAAKSPRGLIACRTTAQSSSGISIGSHMSRAAGLQ